MDEGREKRAAREEAHRFATTRAVVSSSSLSVTCNTPLHWMARLDSVLPPQQISNSGQDLQSSVYIRVMHVSRPTEMETKLLPDDETTMQKKKKKS